MSFINSKNAAFIYAKLTDTGRKLLAQGALTYDYWVFGDSEIDYGFDSPTFTLDKNVILAPKDKNPNIKYPISAQLSGDTFNILPAMSATQQIITNVAQTRGFFTGATQIINGRIKGSGATTTGALTGANTLAINISNGNVGTGDIIMINALNPAESGSTLAIPNLASGVLFYQLQGSTATSGAMTMTLDRPIPKFGSGTTAVNVYVLPGGDAINTFYGSATTIPYWNDNTLSFNSNSNISAGDVPVWNYSAVFTEGIAGVNPTSHESVDTYTTKKYAGFKEYLNYTSQNSVQKSIGIIHYTNNNISNNYGELLKSGTFVAKFPHILWHKSAPSGGSGTGTGIGLVLSAQTVNGAAITANSVQFNTASIPFTLPYDNLVDTNGNIVGKVFYTLKLAVIEDEELVVALSYKSNRNWTLPTLNGSFVAAVSENQGLIGSNHEAHVSYILVNDSGVGYQTGMHCQNYLKVSRGGASQNNIKVNFPINQLPYLKTTYDSTGGFGATKLYMLVQTTLIGQRPVPTAWKQIDVTANISGYSGGLLNANQIEGSSFTIDLATYNSAPVYDVTSILTLPTISETNFLNFGDESFAFANIDSQIQATAYKASFVFIAASSKFNNSVNPTYNSANNHTLYISEVGIYNSLKQLVAIGKISNPIPKTNGTTIQLQLDIDF